MSETHGHHPPWPPAPPLRTDTVSKPPRVRSKRGAGNGRIPRSRRIPRRLKAAFPLSPRLLQLRGMRAFPPLSDADLIPDPPSRSRRRDEDVVWGDVENFLIWDKGRSLSIVEINYGSFSFFLYVCINLNQFQKYIYWLKKLVLINNDYLNINNCEKKKSSTPWIWFMLRDELTLDGGNAINFRVKTRKKNWFRSRGCYNMIIIHIFSCFN